MHPLFCPENSFNISIKTFSIASAYTSVLRSILINGIDFPDERGDKMKAVFNLMVTIRTPLEGLEELDNLHRQGKIKYNRKFLDDYANQLLYGTMKPELVSKQYIIKMGSRYNILYKILNYFNLNKRIIKIRDVQTLPELDLGFVYTYFERLRKRWSRLAKVTFQSFEDTTIVDSEKMDQIEEVVRILNESPRTRRAVCTTWIPSVDLRQEEVPCMNWLIFYKIDGKLNLTVGFRSHDIFGAYISNLYGLTRLLEYVSKRTISDVGSLTIVSVNAHYNKLFEKDVINICRS